MTTVGDGLYHYGGIPVGSGMIPITGLSSDGTMSGRAFYVHGYLGNDGNSGLKPKAALKTVTAAFGLCEDGRGDTIYILNDGSTTATVRDAALVWNKDNTHLVGLGAPAINQRCRIAPPTTSTVDIDAYTPYLTVSATGCIFSNVSWFQGQSEDKASVGLKVTGHRNYFSNLSIITGAATATAAQAATYQLQVVGAENVFEKCYIGQDTIMRAAANANVRFGDGTGTSDQASRNVFIDCIFPMVASETTPVFILTSAQYDSGRWELFKNCTFINTGAAYATGDTIAAGVSWAAATNGYLLLQNCGFIGCTDVTASDSTMVFAQGPASGVCVEVGMFKGIDIA